ncbi:hypothetical protein MIS45_07735 [Wielerella bovis]|uniref:hypothetical protein n=1 Tax=Wielerella bovis TaxID=2917790 RepID=UPI0020192504|nr:hypothetical protein [Wielerella bovis]ULJ68678.1 hypothetical protein MIS45_07735 [Wielerella bovis]
MNKQDKKTALDVFVCKKELKFGIFFDGTGNHREFNFIKTRFLLEKYPLTKLSKINAKISPNNENNIASVACAINANC